MQDCLDCESHDSEARSVCVRQYFFKVVYYRSRQLKEQLTYTMEQIENVYK